VKTEEIVKNDDAVDVLTTFVLHEGRVTKVVRASANETVESILERAEIELRPEVNVFLGEFAAAICEPEEVEDGEDDHEPVKRHLTPSSHGHGGGVVHIHCHPCRRVKTGVSYNGREKHHRFSPAASIETVRRWAVKKFKIPVTDAEKLFVWLPGTEQPLDGTKHVGELTEAPVCSVELLLLPDPRVNG
jgi:hypothetical protein